MTKIRGFVTRLVLIGSLGIVLPAQEAVQVKVQPYAVFAGGAVNVTCLVEPNKDNRTLRIGVSEKWESEKQLEGDRAAKTFRLQVPDIPCEAAVAYCVLQKVDGETKVVQVPIQVLGCE